MGSRKPRLAFVGTGWIGRLRLEPLVASGAAEVVALVDPVRENLEQASALAPGARLLTDMDSVFRLEPDGVVIATPSAAHVSQAIEALDHGAAVFCQKPLARTAAEARRVVERARAADLLLGVDFSYRHLRGMDELRRWVLEGELGQVFSVDLVFHNAYGPDKPWYYQRELSGGGCLLDLGVHLIDLALWALDFEPLEVVDARCYAEGRPVGPADGVEDFALARLETASGTSVRLACSWRLQAGRDAAIEASFYGTGGGARLGNHDGSFFDFELERFRRTSREVVVRPPDDWGGRALVQFARRLGESRRFRPEADQIVTVAEVVESIYELSGT